MMPSTIDAGGVSVAMHMKANTGYVSNGVGRAVADVNT